MKRTFINLNSEDESKNESYIINKYGLLYYMKAIMPINFTRHSKYSMYRDFSL